MMILSLTVAALVHRAYRDRIHNFMRGLGIRTAFKLLGDTLCALLPCLRLPGRPAVQHPEVRESRVCRSSGTNFWRYLLTATP